MQLSLNTNSLSNLVQNSLSGATGRLNIAIERLTTGYKINHAKDNAAGYSISTSLESKLSSYSVAENNVAMGLDLLTTATDNLDLITSHLQRMRDLAEQASNGTYGDDSIAAIQAEFNSRKAEILRIFDNTEYNGVKLFRDSGSKFIEKVEPLTNEEALAEGYTIIKSASDLQAIQNDLDGKYILMDNIDLSGVSWNVIGSLNNAFTGELNGNGYAISNLYINSGDDYQGLFGYMEGAKISNLAVDRANVVGRRYVGGVAGYSYDSEIYNCYSTGVISGYSDVGGFIGYSTHYSSIASSYSKADVVAQEYRAGGLVGCNTDNSTITDSLSHGDVEGNLNIGGLAGENAGAVSNSFATGGVNAATNAGGLAGYANGGSITGCYWNTETSGVTTGIASGNAGGVNGVNSSALKELIEGGVLPGANLLKEEQETEITFQVGIYSDKASQITIDTAFSMSALANLSVSSSSLARKTLNKLDGVLEIVSGKQTEYGASYNRLESALETIAVSIDNLTSSQSTIRDADIAEVSSEYIRNQILQQASATLLATANQSPSFALQLI